MSNVIYIKEWKAAKEKAEDKKRVAEALARVLKYADKLDW